MTDDGRTLVSKRSEMKHQYRYETHLHTREVSGCASCGGAEYIEFYKKLGYAGIIVTDHFFNGNCTVARELAWEERVRQFCLGYEHAKEAGDRAGISVFFGWEANFNFDEYLVYGLDREWLLAHPEIMTWNQREQFEQVHAAGGCLVQAHPFRERNYIKKIKLFPECADAIEVCNGGNSIEQDTLAWFYAKKKGLPMTSGSDIHHVSMDASDCCGVIFDRPLTSIADYVQAVKTGKGYRLITSPDRMEWHEDYHNSLPIEVFNYDCVGKRSLMEEIFK